jgi:hypothetical protein
MARFLPLPQGHADHCRFRRIFTVASVAGARVGTGQFRASLRAQSGRGGRCAPEECCCDKLFSGFGVLLPKWIREGGKLGHEHIGPEDTLDGGYGRLLERAEQALDSGFKTARKGARPWRVSAPNASVLALRGTVRCA